jgi:3-dehydroquinate synthase
MKSIFVKADRNYVVEVGVDAKKAINQICQDHNKVLLVGPRSLIKLFKIKEGKNLSIFETSDGESQ